MGEINKRDHTAGFQILGMDVGYSTNIGRVRQRNEDNFFMGDPTLHDVVARGLCFAVADGMGGHQGGEMASTLAVEVIADFYKDAPIEQAPLEEHVAKIIERANETIFNKAATNPELSRMGTTLSVAHLADRKKLTIWHIGDCRTYLIREGQLRQLTADHSLVADQLRLGIITAEEAANHPARNVITRALGTRKSVKADVYNEELLVGDRLLTCCDGLHGVISEEELLGLVLTSESSQVACQRLTERANEEGGPDNITIVIVHLVRPRGFWSWLKGLFGPGQGG